MMMTDDVCGIYLITNKNTGQMYVGQSINIQKRFREHRRAQDFGHSRIDNAINKYGAENFSFEIVMTIENDTEKLNDAEREWIAILNTYEDNFHYNLTPGGDFNPMKAPEIAAKVSKAVSGENNPMYAKRGKDHPTFGRKHTPEAKAKMSKAKSGENNPMYGKKHSEDAMIKMSRAQNTTGFFRVYKNKNSECKQGFTYAYKYYGDDKKQHSITSVSLEKLEQKVKAKGLEWLKFDNNNGE